VLAVGVMSKSMGREDAVEQWGEYVGDDERSEGGEEEGGDERLCDGPGWDVGRVGGGSESRDHGGEDETDSEKREREGGKD